MNQNAKEHAAVQLVVSRGETSGVTFYLEPGENLVGRWDPEHGAFPEVDLERHDPEAKVSRRHAVIEVRGDSITITDIGSLNGTFINRGKRIEASQPHALKDGDEVIIGKTFLQVSTKS